ncbi:beta-ketoacyl-ACP synthase 3 [Frankia sp. CNm7]|uniref:Beta-ketoacyl-ACP synthase 3 n=1 Tax=Frankia nepalensis TaxID=1836974 RepID=A0A937UMW3_9ACTN|nr:beta-ketoacyl-ACP synthase 3 [Frankia nepalensis]MBL7499216.1 beta-ketoacyl-ACP synthase 3 [Frankia nepalensis]MBL7512138.1 beta-ketoacyl-ACP synthase 3 [Frankia nepalensis]MBL7520909.1 beta-ketoacyl-ACP synthase 3 [Frankia nepalensis]MBL7627287.1 beta-ketoacyl-ACP synthase 3 [Frankia nepalensis]
MTAAATPETSGTSRIPIPAPRVARPGGTGRAPGGARLLGLGAYRPVGRLTSEELAGRFGRTAQWVEGRTGFVTRGVAAADETIGVMALAAAREALADSGLTAADVDLVMVATCSSQPRAGVVAAEVAAGLGAPAAATVDFNAACAGFCYAVAAAADSVRAGTARHAVVVGAERMTDYIDPADLGTSIIFGDGAGAVVIGPAEAGAEGEPAAIGPVTWGSDGSKASLIQVEPDSQRMRMEGQAVFRWATGSVHRVALAACERAGVAPKDLAAVIPHQANLRIVNALAEKLGAVRAVVARDGADAGNTSAASIPLALHRLHRNRAVRAGDLALLVGFGAGLAWAAQVVRVP